MVDIRHPEWWLLAAVAGVRKLPFARFRAAAWMARVYCGLRRPSVGLVWGRVPAPFGRSWVACDLRDSISREIFFNGVYEPLEARILETVLRPGMRFVDVGANRGYFTLLAAGLVGSAGRVLALEPDPRMYDLLVRAIAKSGLHQVSALALAAGAAPETVALVGFHETDGNFGVSKVANARDGQDVSFSVSAQPLDNVLIEHGYNDVDLLKLDVEGYEGFALAGLADALAGRRVHRLLVEFHPTELAVHGHDVPSLIKKLVGYGYTGWQIDHSARAYRKAAYGCSRFQDFVTPLMPHGDLSRWPHTFWVHRGLDWSPVCM